MASTDRDNPKRIQRLSSYLIYFGILLIVIACAIFLFTFFPVIREEIKYQTITTKDGTQKKVIRPVDEEFGIAPVEAMGYGVPVIAYKSGGLKERVKEGVNGFLFDELNSDSLVSKIRTLESLSKEEYEQMRKQARMRAKDFSQEEFKKNILAYINTIRSV